MPSPPAALYELWTDPFTGRDLDVVSFTGREALSRTFTFDVRVLAPPEANLLDTSPLGQNAMLLLQVPEHPTHVSWRTVSGVIDAVEPQGASTRDGRRPYRLRLVPRLALLKHRVTSRIFQNLSVPEIVAKVLDAMGVSHAFTLARRYPMRAYCVQYQESDLAFVERLLAEEGIFYFFSHPPASTEALAQGRMAAEPVVVFGDSVEAYRPLADSLAGGAPRSSPALSLREGQGFTGDETDLTAFSLRQKVRPGSALLRDYDFRRPLLDLRSETHVAAHGDASAHDSKGALRAYHHRGEYDEPEVNPARAEVALAQARRDATLGKGEGHCRRLAPGYHFQLEAEASPHLTGAYAITRVEHEGHTPELTGRSAERSDTKRAYANRFTCVPRSVAFRPRRPRRVLQQVLESATVVGPPGEEIHTDEHGRIKVQFHWDLEGKRDEHSSCWIRVIEPWAGASWGFQFLPRVGMEVMVTFLGGDQDCPVVLGAAYNATHPAPFQLPGDRSRSGIRTQSTPGGGGFNELSFGDGAGREQVYLHAQRDLDEVVGRDHTLNVTGHEAITLGGSRTERVTGSQVLQTAGDVLVQIAGSREEQIAEGLKQTIGKIRSATVHGMDFETIKGSSLRTVEQDMSQRVLGSLSVEIGQEGTPGGADIFASGDLTLSAGADIVLRAQNRIVLACGDSRIEVDPKGIRLHGITIGLSGTDAITAKGDEGSLRLGKDIDIVADNVRLYTAKASLELDESAHLNGKEVRLNCDAGDPEEMVDDEGKPLLKHVSLKLTNADREPYVGKDFILHAGGVKIEGTTDGAGKLEADVPRTATLGEVTLWLDKRPKGLTKRYVLKLEDLAPAGSPLGAQQRLRNLGYFGGLPGPELDAMARAALRRFQAEHELPVTGDLDEATSKELADVHGH